MTKDSKNSDYKGEATSASTAFSGYPVKLFLDANVVLEGKPLEELPWADINNEGPLLALLTPQVLVEIDAKKRDGRLGKIARAFNRLIASVALGGPPVIIREAMPRVALALARCDRIPWDNYDDLDPEDGDSRVVAEALHVQNVPSEEKILVSQDIKPLAFATRHGLQAHHISESWLRPVEATPQDKRIQQLQQRVRDLEKNEPELEVQVEIGQPDPAIVYRITDLSPEERTEIKDTIFGMNPKPRQERSSSSVHLYGYDYDSSLDERYETYRDITVPAFIHTYERKVELLFNQIPFSIQVSNVGQIRADKFVVEIESSEGWLNDKFVFVLPAGPRAPTPRSPIFDFQIPLNDIQPFSKAGRHEVELVEGPDRSQKIVANCEDFRHGQVWTLEGILGLDSHSEAPATISVRVTAANLHGTVKATGNIEKTIERLRVFDLIDRESLKVTRDVPMQAVIDLVTQSENFDLLGRQIQIE